MLTYVPLIQPKTSISWDGDAVADTDVGTINLITAFNLDPSVRAVVARVSAVGSTTPWKFVLKPNAEQVAEAAGGDALFGSGMVILAVPEDGVVAYEAQNVSQARIEIWGYYL